MITIYHSRDMDGFSSGAICKRKFPDTILVGFDYGQDIYEKLQRAGVSESDLAGHNVIMIDVSLKMPGMFELAKKCKTLTWIDHHISAINEYEAVKDQAPENFIAVLENGIAACEVGWKYLFPNEKMPRAIELLGQYDTWRNQDKEHWENQILPFQFGMRLNCHSPQTFPMNLLDGTPNDRIVDGFIHKGHTILEYQANMNRAACGASFEFEFEGLRAICLNGGGFNSDVFKSVYDPAKHDIMMPFRFNGKEWIFSMYSTKPDIDVSAIAKKWGGGGHKAAAGFQVPKLELVFTFLAEKNAYEFHLKQLPSGLMTCELEGEVEDICKMLINAMTGSVDISTIVMATIPTYLDLTNRNREDYCKTIMEAQGAKAEIEQLKKQSNGGDN